MTRDVISDETWAVIGPLFPPAAATGRPPVDRRYNKSGLEPPDHAIGRSRGGLTTRTHLVADGKGRALAFVVTGGQTAGTIMLPTTMDAIRVPGPPGQPGRPRTRPERVLADKGYPSKANRAWLRERGIAMHTDKTARNYHAALCLAAMLHWLSSV